MKYTTLSIMQQNVPDKWSSTKVDVNPTFLYSDEFLGHNCITLNTVRDIAEYNVFLVSQTTEGTKTTYMDRENLRNSTYFVCDKRGIIRRLPCPGGNGIIVERGDNLLILHHNGWQGNECYKFRFEFRHEFENSFELLEIMTEQFKTTNDTKRSGSLTLTSYRDGGLKIITFDINDKFLFENTKYFVKDETGCARKIVSEYPYFPEVPYISLYRKDIKLIIENKGKEYLFEIDDFDKLVKELSEFANL